MIKRWNVIFVALLLINLLCSGCKSSPESQEAKFLSKGKNHLVKSDYNRAILDFNNATKPKPKDAEPWYQLGLAYLGAHRPGDAVLALRKAVQLDPNHHAAQVKLSELMVESSNPEILKQALDRLDHALLTRPGDPDILDIMAMAELKLDKPEDAERHLKEVMSEFPGHLRSAATLAAIELAKGQYDAAEQTLKAAVAKAPQSPEAARALAYYYLAVKRSFEAEQELQRALKLKPDDVLSLRFLAVLQLSEGRSNDADRTYSRLASLKSANLPYIHAAYLLHQGKVSDAIAEFEKLAKDAPSDHDALVRLVSAYLRAGRTADAVSYVTAMVHRNPRDVDALLFRSQIYLRAGKVGEAERDILQVLHFEPNSADAHYGLSRVYGLQGLERSRLGELERVVKLRPGMIDPRVELARAQISSGHPDVALTVMDSTPENLKSTTPAVVGRVWALLALNRVEEATSAVDRGLRSGRSFDLVFQRGILQLMKRDSSGAEATAAELLRDRPLRTEAVDFAVMERVARQQNTEALRILRDAAEQSPNSIAIQYLAGKWYHRLNDRREARAAFLKAAALNPQYAPARIAVAVLDIEDGRLDAARESLSALIALEPRNEPAELLLANLELRSKNRESALAHYRRVAELNPDNVVALNAAAYLLAMENPDEALGYAQRALELTPNDPGVEDTLGSVYYRKGLYSKALEYLTLAASRDPTPVHQFHLAMSYFKVGDRLRGQDVLLKALAKDPKLPETESGW